jgi:hypothetical protein
MELLPCPFCGAAPEFPDGSGTVIEIECPDCGCASAGVQVCDCMTTAERFAHSFDMKTLRYPQEFVDRAITEAAHLWNTRHHA